MTNRRRRAGLGDDLVCQIRAVEAREEDLRVAEFELFDDVLAHALGGGGGEGEYRDVRNQLPHFLEAAVFRAEIVAPLADAVRLVHRQRGDFPALQARQEIRQHQPLRRDVKQLVFARVERIETPPRLSSIQRRVEKSRRHAAGFELVHLVLHQRDERRDDDR